MLSHEVSGLLINLSFHLFAFESAHSASAHLSARLATAEIDKAKQEIRQSAKILGAALEAAKRDLTKTEKEPRHIFAEHRLMALSKEVTSRTSHFREIARTSVELLQAATFVHRTAINIDRMIKISNSLFGDRAALNEEPINPVTIQKDVLAYVPPGDAGRTSFDRWDAPTFLAYRREFISAASNLVRNGLKYSRPGTPSEVRLDLYQDTFGALSREFGQVEDLLQRTVRPHAPWVALKVSDTGRGIPDNLLDIVFKPFVRLDDGGKPIVVKDEGEEADETGANQGFGLTLVKRVAELHDGVAVARSGSPHGMVFGVFIPFRPNQ